MAQSLLFLYSHFGYDRTGPKLSCILGDLITEAANYDPVAAPMPSFTAQKLKLHPRVVADLLICINSSRWHLLSWVMDWPTLEQKCKLLLENPDIRKQDTELKYLVIDYTQFDEWSSEEELLAQTGIGKFPLRLADIWSHALN